MCSNPETTRRILEIHSKVNQIISDTAKDPAKPIIFDFPSISCVAAERWANHLGQSGEFVVIQGVPAKDSESFFKFIQEKMKAAGLSDAIEIQTFEGHL